LVKGTEHTTKIGNGKEKKKKKCTQRGAGLTCNVRTCKSLKKGRSCEESLGTRRFRKKSDFGTQGARQVSKGNIVCVFNECVRDETIGNGTTPGGKGNSKMEGSWKKLKKKSNKKPSSGSK